jgi:thioredoxin reductase/NAD-dependent dihydropyrimidine dehydrogenase PreA subunit
MGTNLLLYLLVFSFIAVFLVWPTYRGMKREEDRARALRAEAIVQGRHEPVSIHPYVDLGKCMGSGACVQVCPEKTVLQIIDGAAQLVHGSSCIGHGACEAACPVNAIELVFGTERRGIDLPQVGPDFQTNVPGLYIAGELGGMGLIANAVRQGVEAVENLSENIEGSAEVSLDLVVVGAGPAGLGAALEAKRRGLRYLLLEQEEFGGAIRHYPRQKLVMSRPLIFPGFGKVDHKTIRKEALITLLEKIVRETGLEIASGERVDAVSPLPGGFQVTTAKRVVSTKKVLIAIGRRGTPRRLGVPGEDLEKVAYRLLEPEEFSHNHVLVVGGGDSALEAALALAEQPDCSVHLSYRKGVFSRARAENQARLQQAADAGRVKVLWSSEVVEIGPDRVTIRREGESLDIPNDFVFIFAGGVLPTPFLVQMGIGLNTHYGKRVVEGGLPSAT